MPTKHLPSRPSLDVLKHQARELLDQRAAGAPQACQRLREFHPRFRGTSDGEIRQAVLTWSDGLFAIAREYGFASWARLKRQVDSAAGGLQAKSYRDRIDDPLLRQAVDLLDDGDTHGLERLLDAHPDLARRHACFEGENYFRAPGLLAFIAENPIRNGCLPPNIVDIADLLIRRGAGDDRADLDETLGLTASGRIGREAGFQLQLIELLCRHGADPDQAMIPALVTGEHEAAAKLVDHGARFSLPVAAALGDKARAQALIRQATAAERHLALALAAQHGRTEILKLLLDAGEDPNRYNPVGAHSHSTPLHQAAVGEHEETVRLLLQKGARTDLQDTLWQGTPIDWAEHEGKFRIAELLRGGS